MIRRSLDDGDRLAASVILTVFGAVAVFLALWANADQAYALFAGAASLGGAVCIWPRKDPTGYMTEMSDSHH